MVTFAKISPQIVNPRDIAGNAEEGVSGCDPSLLHSCLPGCGAGVSWATFKLGNNSVH